MFFSSKLFTFSVLILEFSIKNGVRQTVKNGEWSQKWSQTDSILFFGLFSGLSPDSHPCAHALTQAHHQDDARSSQSKQTPRRR